MGFIISVILLFIGGINNTKRKDWSSPDVFFCYFWFEIMISDANLYALSMPSFLI